MRAGRPHPVAPVMTGMTMCWSREVKEEWCTSEALAVMRSRQITGEFSGNVKLLFKYIINDGIFSSELLLFLCTVKRMYFLRIARSL